MVQVTLCGCQNKYCLLTLCNGLVSYNQASFSQKKNLRLLLPVILSSGMNSSYHIKDSKLHTYFSLNLNNRIELFCEAEDMAVRF